MGKIDEITELAARLAGDAPPVAGYLTYNPGPGIYSRMERAVEALPENVRVQELPGLLKRYKDGIPGWELKAVDLDSLVAGRDVVPRSEILAAVKERSPVYTHREVVLGGRPQQIAAVDRHGNNAEELLGPGGAWDEKPKDYQRPASPIGHGVSHGEPRYEEYGQGGDDYAELLIMQPESAGGNFGSHWSQVGQPYSDVRVKSGDHAVAHARFDTHGDALRINELQSDLGIHNRKIREKLSEPGRVTARYPDGTVYALDEFGIERPVDPQIPFPLEDAWADLLIKRLALEAARGGHRAIEVASPRAIADKVGGNIDNYEHFYGKVVPGAIERLGRKMGGLVDDTDAPLEAAAWRARGSFNDDLNSHIDRMVALADLPDVVGTKLSGQRHAAERLLGDLGANTWRLNSGNYPQNFPAKQIQGTIAENLAAIVGPHRMNEMYLRASEIAAAEAARKHAVNSVTDTPMPTSLNPPGRRYIMSDEMRKRILTEGIPAAIAIGIGTDQVLDRLDREAPKPQMR